MVISIYINVKYIKANCIKDFNMEMWQWSRLTMAVKLLFSNLLTMPFLKDDQKTKTQNPLAFKYLRNNSMCTQSKYRYHSCLYQ